MNAIKNTIKRPLGHKGIKSLSGSKLKAVGSYFLNAVLGGVMKKRIHNALQNNDLLFEHPGIVTGHKESSFHGVWKLMMDEAGGYGNVPASAAKGGA